MSAQELYQQAIKSLAQAATGQGRLEAPDGVAIICLCCLFVFH